MHGQQTQRRFGSKQRHLIHSSGHGQNADNVRIRKSDDDFGHYGHNLALELERESRNHVHPRTYGVSLAPTAGANTDNFRTTTTTAITPEAAPSNKLAHRLDPAPDSDPEPEYSNRYRDQLSFIQSISAEAATTASSHSLSQPIPRSKAEDDRHQMQALELAAEQSYERATWRMYNRIVAYREKHPLPVSYYYTSTTSYHSQQQASHHANSPLSKNISDVTSKATTADPHQDDEMVFDIEI